MNELIDFLELELDKKIDRDKFTAHITKNHIDVITIWYNLQTMNKVAKDLLLDIYKNLDIWITISKQTCYIWKNGIYTSTDDLDDDLWNYYASDIKNTDTIDELVASAYEDSVDKLELTYDEFKEYLLNGYRLNEGVIL